MAADAVRKIKEAEEKGSEAVKLANEKARQILQEARQKADERRKEILAGALEEKNAILEEAVKKAEVSCAGIEAEGASLAEKIFNPDEQRLKKAVGLVKERIVG